MSEEGQEVSQAPTIDISAIKAEVQAELEKKFEDRMAASSEDLLTKAEVNELLAQNQKDLVRRITGEDDSAKNRLPALSEAFLRDPASVLSLLKETTETSNREYLDAQLAAMKQEQLESFALAKNRPDIMKEEKNRELFNRLYDKTDSFLSPKERVAEAVKDYDLLLETAGAGKSEERIKEAQSFSTASTHQGVKKEEPVNEEAMFLKELQDRQERRRKVTNNHRSI